MADGNPGAAVPHVGRGTPVVEHHGILNVDKPAGWTSHDVVAWVRKTLHQRSVGHAGTLDPMATGVLLVCVGQATRLAEYLVEGEKAYRAVARFGLTTDTYDATGAVTATAPVPPIDLDALRRALEPFAGDIQQVPPAYSAIKQNGIAAYRKARRGEQVTLAPRPVRIFSITVLDWQPPDLTLEVVCGPGTYIRSLVHDLGQALGCGAHLTELVRLRSGRFTLAGANSLDEVAAAAAEGKIGRILQPMTAALARLQAMPVDDEAAARLVHGQPIACTEPPAAEAGYAVTASGQLLAVLEYHDAAWWPHKVFSSGDK